MTLREESLSPVSSIKRFINRYNFPVPLAPNFPPRVTESDQRINGTWRRHSAEVFSCFLFPEIQPFIKVLGTAACKSAFIIFVCKERRKEKGGKKKEKSERGKGSQPLQMPHNCTEQMNINVTVKLK